MKKKYILAFGFILVLLVVSVFAIWITSIRTTATYNITSDPYGGLGIEKDLSGGTYESLSGEVRIDDYFKFINEGESTSMNISIRNDISDVDDNCTNWENDCVYNYTLNDWTLSGNLNEGSNIINVSEGINIINFTARCVQYTCPQLMNPSITIEKIPL